MENLGCDLAEFGPTVGDDLGHPRSCPLHLDTKSLFVPYELQHMEIDNYFTPLDACETEIAQDYSFFIQAYGILLSYRSRIVGVPNSRYNRVNAIPCKCLVVRAEGIEY